MTERYSERLEDLFWRAQSFGIAWSRAKWRRGGGFDIDDEGREALVLPVYEHGECIDVCAYEPWGRFGTALGRGIILGTEDWESDLQFGGYVKAFKHPLGWLRGDGGICILCRQRAWIALRGIPRIWAQDAAHARDIKRLLVPPAPDVEVIHTSESEAA